MTVITVSNAKGGVAKTTTAMHIARALVDRGHTVVVVDADKQASARRWHRDAERLHDPLPFALEFVPSPDLVEDVGELDDRYEFVVIDAPPQDTDIIAACIAVADLVVIPAGAKEDDRDRSKAMHRLTADANIPAVVVLCRVKAGETSSEAIAREEYAVDRIDVLSQIVTDRVAYSDAYRTSIPDVGQYGAVLEQLDPYLKIQAHG